MSKLFRSSLFIPLLVLALLLIFICVMLFSASQSASANALVPAADNAAVMFIVDIEVDANGNTYEVAYSPPIYHTYHRYIANPNGLRSLYVYRYADRLFTNGFDGTNRGMP